MSSHESGHPVVFWDFDDTLASRPGRWSGSVVEAVGRVDPQWVVDVELLRQQLRTGFPWHRADVVSGPVTPAQWWDRLSLTIVAACEAIGVPWQTARAAAAALPEIYYNVDAWTLDPEAVAALSAARAAGFRSVILSNHAPELPVLVRDLGLDPFVDTTVVSAAVGAEKPHPMIFRRALELSRADVARSWMIGDNPVADVAGARAVGLQAVLTAPPAGGSPESIGLMAAIEQIVGSIR